VTETYYAACEQHRPYEIFTTLKEAQDEVQPYIDRGYSFQVAEVEVVAFHELPQGGWKREAA
jgi:hypothetical protein